MELQVNRKHKDALFDKLFGNQDGALELYNALNETAYTDASKLTIMTLPEGLFLGFQNDVSFLLGHELNLYEHQSTQNPNMPLRGLFYLATQYQKLVKDENLYGTKPIALAMPRYLVFCNDPKMQNDEEELHLSNLYMQGDGCGDLECIAHVLNVNKGHNPELMERSERLFGYAELIARVRENRRVIADLTESVTLAVESCIEDGILKEFLEDNKMGVIGMILEEYSFEEQIERVRRIEHREALAEGLAEGRMNMLRELVTDGMLSEEEAAKRAGMTVAELRDYLQKFLKNKR